MGKNQNIETWLTFSHALFSDLMSGDLRHAFDGMTADEHAAMVDRRSANVNDALVAMALAAGEADVRQIFNALERDTVIVLCSRWAHYQKRWKELLPDPKAHLWSPPGQKDLWRAVFLAMIGDTDVASTVRERLWPEFFGAPRG